MRKQERRPPPFPVSGDPEFENLTSEQRSRFSYLSQINDTPVFIRDDFLQTIVDMETDTTLRKDEFYERELEIYTALCDLVNPSAKASINQLTKVDLFIRRLSYEVEKHPGEIGLHDLRILQVAAYLNSCH